MRGAVAMQMRSDDEFHRYLSAIFSAMFEHPRNLGNPEEVAAVLEGAGISPRLFLELIKDEKVKAKLKSDTEEAVARGVFGAPTFFVGSDMFWGQDRLDFVDLALS
jgi:2-hydroxychromene-2-carboxylate isomerase